jgi:O-antigen/teichoic acid export membrane protein
MFLEQFRVVRTVLFRWVKTNRVMLANTGSLVCTNLITSALGFMYWWLAARLFSPEAVGLASAAISAMALLATISLLGFGSLLIGELPRQPGKAQSLVSTAILLVGGAGGLAGVVFAMLTPLISKDLQGLRAGPAGIALFAAGVSLAAVTFVLDQALIGLLRGGLQLWRNTLFAATKLVALLAAGLYLASRVGLTIYATWAIGNVFSVLALFAFALARGRLSLKACLPQWGLLSRLRSSALQHHILNLTIMAPIQMLPVLVTILLSARVNAWFYVSFTLANFVSIVLFALTTVLYAMHAAEPAGIARQIRLTLSLSIAISILANCVLFFGARQILNLFGPAYAQQAAWSLRILGLSAFPVIIKDHYIAISRIHNRMAYAIKPMAIGALLELSGPVIGARLGNLAGLSLGWVLALTIEALYMSAAVYRALHSQQNGNLVGMQSGLLRRLSKYHLPSKFMVDEKDELSKDPDDGSFNARGV